MGRPKEASLVTPFAALLYGRPECHPPLRAGLERLFGAVELESEEFSFTFTDYYTASMGPGLQRKLLVFQALRDPAELADWKLAANALEEELAKRWAEPGAPARPVNADPGYLTGAKLVLASTKDFAHRIYLRRGIFAEITLSFRAGAWQAHPWTFPDYRSGLYHAFLRQARDAHLRKGRMSDGGARGRE